MRLAALDLGSNSFHLLVAEVGSAGDLTKIHSRKEVLRLGDEVQALGRLSEPVFHTAYSSVSRLSAVARELRVEKLLTVATSALRDARNGSAFCQLCERTLDVKVEVLSGEAEARLAHLGARSAIDSTSGPVLVVDIGGGSVELAVGEGAACESMLSLPLGFLRLARAFPLSEPGGAARLTGYVQHECEKARRQLGRFDTLLLSGGTARALGKLLDGGVASADSSQVLKLCGQLGTTSPEGLRTLGVDPARSESLAAGAAVVAGILAGLGQRELSISPRGLREGVLLHELEQRGKRPPYWSGIGTASRYLAVEERALPGR